MKELHILSKCNLKQQDNTILYETGKRKEHFPVGDLRDIFIYADMDLNSRFVRFISGHNINLHYFSYYGDYLGYYKPVTSEKNGKILCQQVKCFSIKEKRLFLAKQIILATAANIIRNLSYYHNRKKANLTLIIDFIRSNMKKIATVSDSGQIMGYEGIIKRSYYSTFSSILQETYGFKNRVYRPPLNPINALLSFGNALLYSICITELFKTKLDPAISVLHAINDRSNSLALDLAEIFKPIITDRILFKCINKNILNLKDFDQKTDRCYLNDRGKKKYLQEFNTKISQTFYHRSLNRKISYRFLINEECRKIRDYILHHRNYRPFILWW